MKKLLSIVLFAVIVTACSKDDEEMKGIVADQVTATVQPFTGDDMSLRAYWSQGDVMTVLRAGLPACQLTLSAGAGTSVGTFAGELSFGLGQEVTAIYPKVTGNEGFLTLQNEQNYAAETDINAYDIRFGSAQLVSDEVNIQMSSLLCALKLDIILGTDDAMESINSIEVVVPDRFLSGTFPISSANPAASLQMTNGTDRIKVNLTSTPSAGKQVTAYILTLPCDLSEVRQVKYIITTTNGVFTFCHKPAEAFLSGKMVPVILDVNRFTLVSGEPGEGEYARTISDISEYTNLNDPVFYGMGATDPVYANSYLISEAGNYTFDATVIGNGPGGIMANGKFHTSTASITPKSAALVWQDKPGLIKKVAFSNGKIIFSTAETFTPGNALIAAYTGTDGTGEILWSWHIWMTDKPALETHINLEGHKFTFMDRNLGAVNKTIGDAGSLGLLYQWGRKDPFLNSASATEVVQPILYDIEGKVLTDRFAEIWTSPDKGTIAYTLANPTHFLLAKDQETSADWYYGGGAGRVNRNFYLWGNPEGYVYRELSETLKTIYDPCPVGYRVPGNFAWSFVTYDGHFTPVPEQWSVKGSFTGGYTVIYDGTNTTFYPAQGCRSSAGGLSDAGEYGHYWMSGPFDEISPYVVCFGFANWYIHPDNECNTSTGRAVRCVKE